ncbi:hypothetical protein N7495_002017 [Penicillium taxi]|uniref:uncharacterized protein n=1 Tax=Penicillium taxi TaxID=168475 RepID=UPI0025450A39|nr:uncharacterized protein N7495_002017 [Penicillium taxi]KAJ5901489.1 hypothetical protein N7495_002017 [Penicillium taxi]
MDETSPLLSAIHSPGKEEEFPSSLQGKKVLLATESWGPVNGVSRTTRSLVEYLRAHGVELLLVAPTFKGDVSKPSPWERRLPGVALPYNPDLTVVYPFHLRDAYQGFEPDIIYLASPASLGFQMLLQIRQLRSPPPVILNFQTDLSAYAEIMLPSPLDKFGVWLLAVVQGFLFRARAVRTIFYPCSDIRSYLEEAGAPVDRLVQLGRGVDTTLFTPEKRDEDYRREIAPDGEIILICVCRIAPEKGFQFLAQVAVDLVNTKVPFKLVIVGGNRNPEVENQVKELFDSVRDHVVFTGFQTGNSLARIYASADIFLHCSITETFGLVVLEAMASGISVIARDQGGPHDIIQKGTGYLVPPQDLEQFTRIVREVSGNTELRTGLSQAAREFAKNMTWEKINLRASWKISQALTEVDQESQGQGRRSRVRSGVISSAVEYFCLALAVSIVHGMWLISVVPLIIHGHRFLPRAWQTVRRRFQFMRALPN